jgi:hypothetical protein
MRLHADQQVFYVLVGIDALQRAGADDALQDREVLCRQARLVRLQGWSWGLMSKRAIAYAFDATRKGAVAKALLQDTKGFLVLDGDAATTA